MLKIIMEKYKEKNLKITLKVEMISRYTTNCIFVKNLVHKKFENSGE